MNHVAPYCPPAWIPGQDVRMDLHVCCPRCGSQDVAITHKKGKSIRHCECLVKRCGHRWRRVHDHGVRRVLAAR